MAGKQNRDRYIIDDAEAARFKRILYWDFGAYRNPYEVVRNAPVFNRVALYTHLSEALYRPHIGSQTY